VSARTRRTSHAIPTTVLCTANGERGKRGPPVQALAKVDSEAALARDSSMQPPEAKNAVVKEPPLKLATRSPAQWTAVGRRVVAEAAYDDKRCPDVATSSHPGWNTVRWATTLVGAASAVLAPWSRKNMVESAAPRGDPTQRRILATSRAAQWTVHSRNGHPGQRAPSHVEEGSLLGSAATKCKRPGVANPAVALCRKKTLATLKGAWWTALGANGMVGRVAPGPVEGAK